VLGKLPHHQKKKKEIYKCIGIGIGEYQKKNIGTCTWSLKNVIGASLVEDEAANSIGFDSSSITFRYYIIMLCL